MSNQTGLRAEKNVLVANLPLGAGSNAQLIQDSQNKLFLQMTVHDLGTGVHSLRLNQEEMVKLVSGVGAVLTQLQEQATSEAVAVRTAQP